MVCIRTVWRSGTKRSTHILRVSFCQVESFEKCWRQSLRILIRAVVVPETDYTRCEVEASKTSPSMLFTEKLVALTLPDCSLSGEFTNRALGCAFRARTSFGYIEQEFVVPRRFSIEPLEVIHFFGQIDPTQPCRL